jgi:hypothetical protein
MNEGKDKLQQFFSLRAMFAIYPRQTVLWNLIVVIADEHFFVDSGGCWGLISLYAAHAIYDKCLLYVVTYCCAPDYHKHHAGIFSYIVPQWCVGAFILLPGLRNFFVKNLVVN